MKHLRALSVLIAACTGISAFSAAVAAPPAPKKLLVVTVTLGYRHGSIAQGETALSELADKSKAFTVDFVRQPATRKPDRMKKPELKPDASAEDKAKFEKDTARYETLEAAFPEADKKYQAELTQTFSKLAPESLKNYDGVIFCNTTGELPLPDPEGFLAWIKEGHAFIGMHAATDTFHKWPGYIEMIGGEFAGHGAQTPADLLNQDPKHPANKDLPATWQLAQEELYRFSKYDPTHVHELLIMDKYPPDKDKPGHYPVSWCREYGKGKVFYTSLGHREDLWSPTYKDRKNSPEVSAAFQAHILGGIKWALGLEPGEATPQAK